MLDFNDFILLSEDPHEKSFLSFYRTYMEYIGAQYRKLNQHPPRLSLQMALGIYERVITDLNEAEKRKKAEKGATVTSVEVTDAVTTMISSSVKYATASHLEMLKRANQDSDEDFEQASSIRIAKKKKQEPQSIDPWADLEKASISLHNGERGIRLPKVPKNLPSNHLLLFKIAHQCLEAVNGPFKKVTDTVNLKDALVAASCILNLRSPSAPTHFPASFVAKATDGCYEDGYDRNKLVSRCFAGLTDTFKAEGVLGLRDAAENKKAVFRKERQARDSTMRSQEEKLMDIIEIACDLVLEKQFEEPYAEADTLHIWLKIFEKLLPVRLRMKTGESVLTCSKPGMQQKDEDMMGRKVDLKFLFDGVEVAVIEFKSASQAKGAVTKQFRKSLRLGKSILLDLEARGVEDAYVVCGDVVGFMGSFTKLMSFEDIYVAGKITDTIIALPTTKHTLLKFLDGKSVSVLLNFLNYLDDLGSRTIDASEAAAVLADEDRFEQQIEHRKPVAFTEKKTFQNSVTYSPTLKRM